MSVAWFVLDLFKNHIVSKCVFQELFELAQRKLLRQLTIYAENQDTDIYPRLLLADFVKESVSDIDTSDSETVGELPVGMYMYGGLVKESVSDIDTSDLETVGELPVGMYMYGGLVKESV